MGGRVASMAMILLIVGMPSCGMLLLASGESELGLLLRVVFGAFAVAYSAVACFLVAVVWSDDDD